MQLGKSDDVSQATLRSQKHAGIEPGAMPPVDEIRFSARAKVWTVVILVGLSVALILKIGEVLPPFIWALVTAFVFNDLLTALTQRTGRPRWVWVTAVFVVFFGVIILVALTVVPSTTHQVEQLVKDVPVIQHDLDTYLANNDMVDIGGVKVSSDTVQKTLSSSLSKLQETLSQTGPELLKGTFRFAIDFVVYLIATLYLMLIGSRSVFSFINTLPLRYRGETRNLVLRIDTVLGAYIKGQFLLIGIMSVASFVVLTILEVRYALVLAIMVGVLELVPFVGPYLAITICSAVAFFQDKHAFGLSALIVVIILAVALFVLRQIEDYVIIPNVIGRIVELPALMVIFTVIAGAALLGPMGLLLGVPVVAALKIIVGYLYYKLVDADREKVILPAGTDFLELLSVLEEKSNRRLLVGVGHEAPYLEDPENLLRLQQISQTKRIDLAFNCGNEHLCNRLRTYGFSVVELTQEHFATNVGR
jgi:predicted PurR-regulated permease PerM